MQEQLPSTQPSKLRRATGAIYPAPDFGIFHHGEGNNKQTSEDRKRRFATVLER